MERYCELIAALKLRTTNKAGRHLSTGRAIELIEDHGADTGQGLVELIKAYPFTWVNTKPAAHVTGTAIRTGQPVVGRNFHIETDFAGPVYGRLQEQTIKAGYLSAPHQFPAL